MHCKSSFDALMCTVAVYCDQMRMYDVRASCFSGLHSELYPHGVPLRRLSHLYADYLLAGVIAGHEGGAVMPSSTTDRLAEHVVRERGRQPRGRGWGVLYSRGEPWGKAMSVGDPRYSHALDYISPNMRPLAYQPCCYCDTIHRHAVPFHDALI